jgi:S-DNA-T family DNA segregation ATPase FtsK/SpoIIIE
MDSETAFFILYILLIIFFFLYFLLSLIFYFNLSKESFDIEESLIEKKSVNNDLENKLENSLENNSENGLINNLKNNLLKNKLNEKGSGIAILNLPEIDIKPFLFEEQNEISFTQKESEKEDLEEGEEEKDEEIKENEINEKDNDKDKRIEENKEKEKKRDKGIEENEVKDKEQEKGFEETISEDTEGEKKEFLKDNYFHNEEIEIIDMEEEEVKLKNTYNNLINKDDMSTLEESEEIDDDLSKMRKNKIDETNIIDKIDSNTKYSIDNLLPESPHSRFISNEDDEKVIEEKGSIILKTLRDFGIESKLLSYIKGPVVTRFELEIDEKVNLGKLINLEKNITYNLSAEKIRILAPIPGKKAVGIEIPNEIKQIVYFTDLAKSEEFKNSNMSLPFILGKDIEGKIQVTDISKSPHLLIAGRTGSGKSVCINTLIASLVLANPPEKVRLILIDPKRVELSLYNDLPHLLTDEIIIFPEDASSALKWLVSEMENRYSLLKDHGFRSIEDYNQSMIEKLPYLVLIIDEFYALMQTSQKIIEDSLIHLSAMARAVGIHLIFATQRPSAEVVTGVIKSNLPSRIAFQTFSKTDSRIILDTNGAESLLGNGDMLFSFAGLPPVRIQGAFISTNEVRELVKKISKSYSAERKSINELFSEIKKEDNGYNDEFLTDDPLYPQAIEIVKKERKVSAYYLQRRLKIGYNRAARIVEQMEEEGIISPLIDGKRREIYI